jgi:hypothetical protein
MLDLQIKHSCLWLDQREYILFGFLAMGCTDKKKTKFTSSIRKFRWDRVQSHIQYEEGLPNT